MKTAWCHTPTRYYTGSPRAWAGSWDPQSLHSRYFLGELWSGCTVDHIERVPRSMEQRRYMRVKMGRMRKSSLRWSVRSCSSVNVGDEEGVVSPPKSRGELSRPWECDIMDVREWKMHRRNVMKRLVERRDHIQWHSYYGCILHMQTLRMPT